jgi:hypothetical protein
VENSFWTINELKLQEMQRKQTTPTNSLVEPCTTTTTQQHLETTQKALDELAELSTQVINWK